MLCETRLFNELFNTTLDGILLYFYSNCDFLDLEISAVVSSILTPPLRLKKGALGTATEGWWHRAALLSPSTTSDNSNGVLGGNKATLYDCDRLIHQITPVNSISSATQVLT